MIDTVRLARDEDVAAVAAIDEVVNASPWRAAQLREACNAAGAPVDTIATRRLLVVETEQHVCGFIVVSWVFDYGEIQNLGVTPEKQSKGLGRLLVAAALEVLRGKKVRRCLLEVRSSNETAFSLYRKIGFVVDGVRKNYYPTDWGREDAVLMSLELNGVISERT